jgi:NAD(P)-dependent dehydrogenase (short-subunit alcohol dehydrogenase family)
MIDLGLEGKGAVVSGAGNIAERAGHGRMTSLKLAAAGATVACIDIDKGRAEEIAAEVEGAGGSIVALASADGINAASMHAPYGAAKAGVISLAKSFAQELGRHGIRVNAVAPGNVGSGNEDWPEGQWAVNTINPLAPPRTRDIANAVLFLSSALAERITGQTLVVDGGANIRELWGINEDNLGYFKSGQHT